jgi:hypothetical protein
MTIKISQLPNLTIATDTTSIPVIDYVANALTTLQANISTLRTYFTSNLYVALSANIVTVNASIVAANVGMRGYVDYSISSNVTTLNSAIILANTSVVSYVNQQVTAANTAANTAIILANTSVVSYVNQQVTAANTSANTANIAMKGYVDSAISTANANVISYINQQVTAANTSANTANIAMLGYVNSQSFYSNTKVATYLQNYSGSFGNANSSIAITGTTTIIYSNLQLGYPSPIAFNNVVLNAVNSANGYAQLNIQNIDSVGTNNSADFIATAPDGTDSSKYIDMGINGNNFVSSTWTVSGKDDGYVYVNSGNLTLGTDTPGKTVSIHVGGTLAANVIGTFNATGLTIAGTVASTYFTGNGSQLTGMNTYSNVQVATYLPTYSGNVGGIGHFSGNLILGNTYTPSLANSVGTTGQIAWSSGYVYICVAPNSWRRANLAIW